MHDDPPTPAIPTDALPGSREKVSVLCQRAERREGLWHHRDTLDDDRRGILVVHDNTAHGLRLWTVNIQGTVEMNNGRRSARIDSEIMARLSRLGIEARSDRRHDDDQPAPLSIVLPRADLPARVLSVPSDGRRLLQHFLDGRDMVICFAEKRDEPLIVLTWEGFAALMSRAGRARRHA